MAAELRACTDIIKNGGPVTLPDIVQLVVFDADSSKELFCICSGTGNLVGGLAGTGCIG